MDFHPPGASGAYIQPLGASGRPPGASGSLHSISARSFLFTLVQRCRIHHYDLPDPLSVKGSVQGSVKGSGKGSIKGSVKGRRKQRRPEYITAPLSRGLDEKGGCLKSAV